MGYGLMAILLLFDLLTGCFLTEEGLLYALKLFLRSYLSLFFVGAFTLFGEWKQIRASKKAKLLSPFFFPLFIFSFVPIGIASLFMKFQWKPIEHKEEIGIEKMEKIEEIY